MEPRKFCMDAISLDSQMKWGSLVVVSSRIGLEVPATNCHQCNGDAKWQIDVDESSPVFDEELDLLEAL